MHVTDTHPLIYFFAGQKKLSAPAKQIFEDALSGRGAVYVPVATVWELSMLVSAKKIALAMPFSEWVDRIFEYPGIILYQFNLETLKIFHDTRFHSDPFDRAIVASALQLGLPLITNDSVMHRERPCSLFWD